MLRHLAPVIIPETIGAPAAPNAAYIVVEELVSAIKDHNIKNVAVSADYGAGKSSVVETAKAKIIKEEDIHWWRFKRKRRQSKFLTVSLAQLNANGRFPQKETKAQGKGPSALEKDKDIEYSLLQQLLYYDLPSKTPKSRFYRLSRIGFFKPLIWAVGVLLAFVAYVILLEPESFRVPSFYDHFAVGSDTKFWIDCSAVTILALLFVMFCVWLVRHARIRIGKVKVKDAEFEVNTLSVFNQYLDEIIYFFASTRYNVVIFEDLDRFADTGRIFGKLRELNKILNSSQYLRRLIRREITFVYSVRDDLFDATRRVKFFDYIVPVIPVVNSSNAYEKLSEFLDEEDKRAFDGKDLLNLCEHFEDLRLIINIVNEYDLYKKVIRLDDFKLSRKKLFGLIVYKNYCPHDFIHLHNNRGVLANILDNKKNITEAAVAARKLKKETEEEKLKGILAASSEWERKLRQEYVDASKNQTNYNATSFVGFELQDGTHVSFEQVADDPSFFEELITDTICFYGGNRQTFTIKPFSDWQKVVNNKPYQERLKLNPHIKAINNQQEVIDNIHPLKLSSADSFATILKEENEVLDDYLDKKPVSNRPFIPEERHSLLKFLISHDFLDEHYLDYITYFYPNSISVEDKRFILNITSLDKESLPCTFHLQNPASVANRFEKSDYETNMRLLNVDLALSLTLEGDKQKDNRNALQQLAMRSKAIDFVLAIYARRSEDAVDDFLTELLEYWDFGVLINSLDNHTDRRLPKLREINLCYSDLKNPDRFNAEFQTWLNGHFGFLMAVFETVGETRLGEWLEVYKPKFNKINLSSVPATFANNIINGGHFAINTTNIDNIVVFLDLQEDYNKAAFTTLYNCTNQSISDSIRQNPQEYIKAFPSSSIEEEQWAKSIIAAEDRIPVATRKEYLRKQSTKIQKANILKESALDFVFKYSVIEPTWDNIYYLCFELQHEPPINFLKENDLKDFLQLHPEEQNIIVTQWVFSNSLPFNVYERVVSTMYGFRKLESDVELRRIAVLVSKQLLLFNVDNYSDMRKFYPSLAVKFVESNLNIYLNDVQSYTVTAAEMMGVLKSIGTLAKQADYIASHPAFEGQVTPVLADLICGLVNSRHLSVETVEEDLLIQSIKYSSNNEKRLFVARKMLFGLDYEPERCKKILMAMGGEYARLCDPGSYSWLVWNANNIRIAKILTDKSFIKGHERYGKRIKVLKDDGLHLNS